MKKYISILLALLPLALFAQTDSLPEAPQPAAPLASVPSVQHRILWDQANTAYINANYRLAAELYDSIRRTAGVSEKLYYNLGNAWFKMGSMGRAILYYNKAQRLAPTDGDIEHNLAVANTYVKDKIEQVPEFFLARWIRSVRTSLGSDTWTYISFGMLALALAGTVVYLLARTLGRRKAGFYTGIVCGVLFIAATAFAFEGRSEMLAPGEGIVMNSAVAVKSSPDAQSKDLFVLHEGTKVKVVDRLQGWIEVTIADGNKGWIEASTIEMI